jgi:hypothetical protein
MFGLLALVLAFSVFAGRLGAQVDTIASPVASPQTGECVTGAGDASAPADGTPVAGDLTGATPAATDVTDALIAAADNVINCYNAGDVDSLVTLVTGNLVADKFGGTVPEELLTYTLLGYGEASVYGDGRIGLPINYLAGDYQYVASTWVFVDMDGEYVLDEEILQTAQPEGDSVVKGFAVADDAAVSFPQGGTTAQLPVISLLGTNAGEAQHIVNLYYLGGLDTPTPEVAGVGTPAPVATVPEDATLVGTVSLAGGEISDIALVNAPVGNYVLVDTYDGSLANFTVTEPIVVEI